MRFCGSEDESPGVLPVFRTIGNATCATGWPRRRQRDVLLLMSSTLVPASYLTPRCRRGISLSQLAAPAATKANPAKAGGTKPRVRLLPDAGVVDATRDPRPPSYRTG